MKQPFLSDGNSFFKSKQVHVPASGGRKAYDRLDPREKKEEVKGNFNIKKVSKNNVSQDYIDNMYKRYEKAEENPKEIDLTNAKSYDDYKKLFVSDAKEINPKNIFQNTHYKIKNKNNLKVMGAFLSKGKSIELVVFRNDKNIEAMWVTPSGSVDRKLYSSEEEKTDINKSYKEKMKSSYSCKMCGKKYNEEEKMKKCSHDNEKSMDEVVIPRYGE